ncbi:heavy metal-associated isoprenylated plant protein 7-like [Hordeum vulgare subsp. vulgare]|uniref:HMA domain-containing protein n=1 Tax=Hordeum vulgare subsp. vulgare TaxID=112509 RepID=A0A8I6XH08_HORVV|nr:heavy metal-associated isoprenylated plant protein 7-like [Hordeum vulgare subsp. vulgare]
MGGETKVVEETKVELKTAVYKVHVHCGQCARDIETQFTEFHGVQEVKLDAGSGKVTVRGVGFDEEKLRVKVSKGCRRNVEYIPPPPPSKDIFTEIKSTKEEIKIITVKVPLHCPDCAVRVKEILLEHKSIYAAKTDFGKGTCVIEGVIEEKKLTEYIYQRTRKHCIIDKVETTVRIVEETVVVKKNKEEVVDKVVEKVAEVIEEKIKEVVAPYFLPCTHPHFVDYSHPSHRCGGGFGDGCSPYGGGGYGYGHGHGYGGGCGSSYSIHSELRGYQDTSFLHCSHPVEFLSHENPNGCSVM